MLIQKGLDQANRRWRIDGQSDFFAERADLPYQRSHVIAQFDVDVHLIGAGPCERFQKNFRLGTHQVHIEKQLGQRAQRLHHGRTEGDVRHEMAVHDVEMQPIRP